MPYYKVRHADMKFQLLRYSAYYAYYAANHRLAFQEKPLPGGVRADMLLPLAYDAEDFSYERYMT